MLLALPHAPDAIRPGHLRTAALIPYGIVTVAAAYGWQYAWTPAGGLPVRGLQPQCATHVRGKGDHRHHPAEIWKTAPFIALLLLAGPGPDASTTCRRPRRWTAPPPGNASSGSRLPLLRLGDPGRPAVPTPRLSADLRPASYVLTTGHERDRVGVSDTLATYQPAHRAEPAASARAHRSQSSSFIIAWPVIACIFIKGLPEPRPPEGDSREGGHPCTRHACASRHRRQKARPGQRRIRRRQSCCGPACRDDPSPLASAVLQDHPPLSLDLTFWRQAVGQGGLRSGYHRDCSTPTQLDLPQQLTSPLALEDRA